VNLVNAGWPAQALHQECMGYVYELYKTQKMKLCNYKWTSMKIPSNPLNLGAEEKIHVQLIPLNTKSNDAVAKTTNPVIAKINICANEERDRDQNVLERESKKDPYPEIMWPPDI